MIVRPQKVYDFTAFARRQPTTPPPGDRIDAQLANHADAIVAVQLAVEKLQAAVEKALQAPTPSPREATLPVGVLGPNAGGFYAGDDKGATATSADYAQVSIDWAEHMPDVIPNQTMAVMAVTGQHWSSRWWANQAALSLGNYLPLAGGQMTGPLVIPVVANLNVGGGATGQVLTTVGSGVLGWSTPSGMFVDAPSNSQYYSRYNGGWVVSPGGLTDAPNDGTLYARKSQAWTAVPAASTVAPVMDGTAAVGVGTTWARADHVHPSDTSRYAASNPSGFQTAAQVTASLGAYLLKSGGAMTGTLIFNNDANFFINGNASENVFNVGAGDFLGYNRSTGLFRFVVANNTVQAMTLDQAGNMVITGTATKPGGGSWAAPSDARIKTVEGDYKGGLDEVLKLAPVVYRYKDNHGDPNTGLAEREAADSKSHIGLIAQAVELVMPEMVTSGPGFIDGEPVDDMRTLDTTPLLFALVNCVKELASRLTVLEEQANARAQP